jgi:acetyltransferase
MTREDIRMRFFAPLRELSHALSTRLSHIDYDRQMALMAQHGDTILGVARYAADLDRRSAEFAAAVRSDWKGRGVGYLLMTRLIEIAREAEIGELTGLVLQENKPMLNLCRALGFTIQSNPDDATVATVRKRLTPAPPGG